MLKTPLLTAKFKKLRVNVRAIDFYRYEKYLPATWRFTDIRLADRGIVNLKFKGYSMVPAASRFSVFDHKATWDEYVGTCVNCPATPKQIDCAREYAVDVHGIHYQHWTANGAQTYEQMVGDECYGGMNS